MHRHDAQSRLGDWPGPPIVSTEHEAPIQARGVSMPSAAQKVPRGSGPVKCRGSARPRAALPRPLVALEGFGVGSMGKEVVSAERGREARGRAGDRASREA